MLIAGLTLDARCYDGAAEATPEWLSEEPDSNSLSFTNSLSGLKQVTSPLRADPRKTREPIFKTLSSLTSQSINCRFFLHVS